MKQIRLKVVWAHPDYGVHFPGEIITVFAEIAIEHVKRGYAEFIEGFYIDYSDVCQKPY